MKIGNDRLFPYPILRDRDSDYEGACFNVIAPEPVETLSSLRISCGFETDCPEILRLISEGKAEYGLHLECSASGYRELLHGRDPSFEHEIALDRLEGTLERVGFVFASECIEAYAPENLHADLAGMAFSISRGSILAYRNLDSIEIRHTLDGASDESIFVVYKLPLSGDAPMEVNMEQDSVMIGLAENEYNKFRQYSKDADMRRLLNSCVVLPALVYVLGELTYDESFEQHRRYMWLEVLSDAYAKRGESLEELLCDPDSQRSVIQIAQELMHLPVADAFVSLSRLDAPEDTEDEE